MIFPAMDLMDGGCVRLLKGDFEARTNYDADPITVARGYADAGADWMHIVDLDGAKSGKAEQSDLILEIANSANICLLYTSPSPRDQRGSRMPSSA